eukprot:363080-Chlamydomonas_euryale.AAC.1
MLRARTCSTTPACSGPLQRRGLSADERATATQHRRTSVWRFRGATGGPTTAFTPPSASKARASPGNVLCDTGQSDGCTIGWTDRTDQVSGRVKRCGLINSVPHAAGRFDYGGRGGRLIVAAEGGTACPTVKGGSNPNQDQ